MPPLPLQRQALKWPHVLSHYSNCCNQERQVASPSTNTPGADLLLSGYFLIEGKKQATLSCFASSCYSEHLILGSKQQEEKPTWSMEWNLWGRQEKKRRDSSCYKTGPPQFIYHLKKHSFGGGGGGDGNTSRSRSLGRANKGCTHGHNLYIHCSTWLSLETILSKHLIQLSFPAHPYYI